MRNTRVPALALAVTVLSVVVGCTAKPVSNPPEGAATQPGAAFGYSNFLTAVAADVHRDYTVYWLGTQFIAGGVVYGGPSWATVGASNDGDELDLAYIPARQAGSFALSLFSRDGWAAQKARIARTWAGSVRAMS